MLAHYKSELICDLAEYYHILDYRGVPGRLLGTLAVGLRAESRIGQIREGLKTGPSTIMLVKIYDILAQVFSKDGKAPTPLLNKFIIEEKDPSKTPRTFKTGEDFKEAWRKINKGEQQ